MMLRSDLYVHWLIGQFSQYITDLDMHLYLFLELESEYIQSERIPM